MKTSIHPRDVLPRARCVLGVAMCLGLASGYTATVAVGKHARSKHRVADQTASARTAAQQDVAFRFAGCMREHGAQQPDPAPVPGKPGLTLDIVDSGPNVAAARSACQPILNELTDAKAQAIGPAGLEARKQEASRFVACMRAHGVTLGEPQAPLYEVGPLLDQADHEVSKAAAPALQAAKAACMSLSPGYQP